jgi:hypothetical protein
VVASNSIKALADKTNTTAIPKRGSAVAGLDDDMRPQKRRRADGTQPARPSGKKTERTPQQSRARPARTMEATEETEEKEAPKRARKVKMPAPAPNAFSDGEDSELETVTKEEYTALEEEEKKAQSATKMNGTKRARDEGDEEDAPPTPKKAKVAAPPKKPAGDSNSGQDALTTGSDVSAVTPAKKASGESKSGGNALATGGDAPAAKPDQVASPPRKKGVARLTDGKTRKADAARLKRNANGRAETARQTAEREAIEAAGGTAVRTENFLKM